MGKNFRTSHDPRKLNKRLRPKKIVVKSADGQIKVVRADEFKKKARPASKSKPTPKTAWRISYDEYMTSPEWAMLRYQVLARDRGLCQMCGRRPHNPHVHHITYERFKNELLSDLLTLCPGCHTAIHKAGGERRSSQH